MNTRTLILTTCTLVALAVPATGGARSLPTTHGTKVTKVAKAINVAKVTGRKATTRPLCICVVPLGPAVVSRPTLDELYAAWNADLTAHGLEALYPLAADQASTDATS
jgi:hypothetical protein